MEDIVKALLQATSVQQETNRQVAAAQQETNRQVAAAAAVQQETNRLLTLQIEALTKAQQSDHAVLKATLDKMTTQGSTNPPAGGVSQIRASSCMQKMTPDDDVETYLLAFERTATREGWPPGQWAGIIAPFLLGEAQKAYFDLDEVAAADYPKLKGEILARLGVTSTVRAQRFYNWRFKEGKAPRSQMFDLIHLARKWLKPETQTPAKIIETLVLDRYMRELPNGLREWVTHGNPLDCDSMVAQVERYLSTKNLDRSLSRTTGKTQRTGDRRSGVEADFGSGARFSKTDFRGQNPGKEDHPRSNSITCFECGAKGHVRARCPNLSEPMQCGLGEDSSDFCGLICLAGLVEGGHTFRVPVLLDRQETVALVDSGSALTLVASKLVKPCWIQKHRTMGVLCIHGCTVRYPTANIEVLVQGSLVRIVAVVVPRLPYPLIIGRNFPNFHALLQSPVMGEQGEPEVEQRNTGVHEVFPFAHPDLYISNPKRGKTRRERRESKLRFNRAVKEVLLNQRGEQSRRGGAPRQTEDEAEVGQPEPPPEATSEGDEGDTDVLDISGSGFGRDQADDPLLQEARSNVVEVNGVPVEGVTGKAYPYFVLKNDLLYRVTSDEGQELEQLVVPSSYTRKILDYSHSHLLGGHLGVEKTQERVLRRFFWPGVYEGIKRYCASCPECQLASPRPKLRAPLIPLPIVDVPFERIGMDLVGPLEKTARGHQYILVILDYATRYPEAIPLRKANAKSIAKELVQMFTRVGIPRTLLTDQGTPFVSRIMKELCQLFNVQTLRTSVYHPQTDGLVERFNRTLKGMLRKVVSRDGKDWDLLLPYLLFAVREIPQSSTGFSPFELLYGRHPRGILDILKETWEEQGVTGTNVLQYVEDMRVRMAQIAPLVRQHMEQAQSRQKSYYDQRALVRQFERGDRVMVLVPTAESKLLAQWQGPYEVLEKLSPVNYKISQPGRRKKEAIFHINLLKPWRAREDCMATVGDNPPVPQAPSSSVTISPELTPEQVEEARGLVERNSDVFSPDPGQTREITHDIITEPGVVIRVKSYRIPESKREAVRAEVRKMLELGVIEESHSQWCSPIVLVPKPDGSIRFCNDFRKLNEVSKFDAYPMPRVDELVERLAKDRFFTTLDLTKGYWQIPLTKHAREKTAFATPDGLFQYRIMPFGLHGAPATFQRLMDKLLRPHTEYAAAYLDDVIIHSPDWESHLDKVQAVLDTLRRAGLTANPSKCALGLAEARYLGYLVGRGLVKPQMNKIGAIQSWPRPLRKKQVRAFLGIVGYYRRFIPHFATRAAPLTDLIKARSSDTVKWNSKAEEAFAGLRAALCAQPVLVAPDFGKEFFLQTDASEVGLGAVLSQNVDGEEHPVLYLSRKLLPREQRYATVEKECLAIKWAVETLRYYVLGRRFTLVTDHAPLKWMHTNRDKNARVTRWFLSLQPFSFVVRHRAGLLHSNADALSRVHGFAEVAASHTGVKLGGRICDRVHDSRYVSVRLERSAFPVVERVKPGPTGKPPLSPY